MIFFGHVSAAGILELDHPELYGDLLKAWNAAAHDEAQRVGISLAAVPQVARTPSFFLNASRLSRAIAVHSALRVAARRKTSSCAS
jgi:hypothetical protein